MSSEQKLNRLASVGKETVTEGATYPYITDYDIVGFSVINKGATTLEFGFIDRNGNSVGDFSCETGDALTLKISPSRKVTMTTASEKFYLILEGTIDI